jgi:hypothetical protein
MSAEDRYELNRVLESGYKFWLAIEANSRLNMSMIMTFKFIKEIKKSLIICKSIIFS